MKSTKCTSCGANIEIDLDKKNFKCPYCGTYFVNDDNEGKEVHLKTELDTTIVNTTNVEENKTYPNFVHKTRPKINWVFAIILACFYFIPACVYVIAISYMQKVWDEYHDKNKE